MKKEVFLGSETEILSFLSVWGGEVISTDLLTSLLMFSLTTSFLFKIGRRIFWNLLKISKKAEIFCWSKIPKFLEILDKRVVSSVQRPRVNRAKSIWRLGSILGFAGFWAFWVFWVF